jgi:hypothetical protein
MKSRLPNDDGQDVIMREICFFLFEFDGLRLSQSE